SVTLRISELDFTKLAEKNPFAWRRLASELADRLRHDPPPLKWSDLRYVFDIKEDCNGKEAIQARRDRRQVAAGRCSSVTRPEHGGRNPPDRRERGDVLSVASGVRWAEDRAGEAAEGP